MAEKRYFHISDILSVATNYILGSKRNLVSPDGMQRKNDAREVYMDLCSFSSGVDLRNSKDDHCTYDADAFHNVRDIVRDSILYRYDWLKEISFPIEEVPQRTDGTQTKELKKYIKELERYIEDFVASIRQCYDVDEWLEVEQQSLRELAKSKAMIIKSPTLH